MPDAVCGWRNLPSWHPMENEPFEEGENGVLCFICGCLMMSRGPSFCIARAIKTMQPEKIVRAEPVSMQVNATL